MKRAGLPRLRDQRGFTLIELMVAATVGIMIVGVAFGLLDSVVRTFGSAGNRVDVSQRGRLAVDQLTARLRSQVCGGGPTNADPNAAYTPAIVLATDNKVAFWSNVGDGQGRRLRALQYANGSITEYTYAGSDPNAAPATTRQIVSTVAATNGTGLFKYFAYNPAAADQAASPAPALYLALTTPLAAADLQRVVRTTIAYTAYPENGTPTDKLAADFSGDFLSRTAASPYEFRTPPLPSAGNLESRCE
jgi:prepilin-type N-terminal cleavage/methylation domain-containing protein